MSRVELTADLTRKVAKLARLRLTEDEVSRFTDQLEKILEYIVELQKIDTTGVEPLTHPLAIEAPLRADEVREFPRLENGASKVTACGPETQDGAYEVPPVL